MLLLLLLFLSTFMRSTLLHLQAAENAVEVWLTGGVVDPSSPHWWGSLVVATGAGFAAPLPYNYYNLRKYGKSCH